MFRDALVEDHGEEMVERMLSRQELRFYWVAVKELKLSYHNRYIS